MARRPEEYLADILEAVSAIRAYTRPGKRAFQRNAMARDAVIARLVQIGEAVKGAQAGGIELEKLAPQVPWTEIAGMRDILSHQYWRTDPQIVWGVIEKDLKPLRAAAARIAAARARRTRRPRRKA
jgi:uncharacterized protein with HEPN domain